MLPALRHLLLNRSPVWWLAGGISRANCMAAYQPKSAASLADSYINLANPGTNDAAPGTAPSFASTTGWSFASASTQYLTTGLVPSSEWSLICRYADINNSCVFVGERSTTATTARLQLGWSTANRNNYAYAGFLAGNTAANSPTTGVAAITSAAGSLNGVVDISHTNAWSGTALAIYIGALNQDGSAVSPVNGNILAVAIYNITLSPVQVLALTTAMQAL